MNIDEQHENIISVVIATAGRDSIYKTIQHLNLSTIIPDEIIIVIPKIFRENHQKTMYDGLSRTL